MITKTGAPSHSEEVFERRSCQTCILLLHSKTMGLRKIHEHCAPVLVISGGPSDQTFITYTVGKLL